MNGGNSKSLLPLVEILISIGIFAVAVVLTLQLFLLASFLGDKTSDTAMAIFEVQNVAETIKSMQSVAELEKYMSGELNASDSYDGCIIYYDSNWSITASADSAFFMMKITDRGREDYYSGSLYKFTLDFYRAEAYPFIDERKLSEDKTYIPLLVSVDANKFIKK